MIIGQGAEATITRDGAVIIKDRITKDYRHPVIDKRLRSVRARAEARLLEKASKLIPVPKVIELRDTILKLEFIEGPMVKDLLDDQPELAEEIGINLAKLHKNNIVHGDLTTSNMIFKDKIYFIDFGLSMHTLKLEDKAVDVHLFKQALESKHHEVYDKALKLFLKGYRSIADEAILDRLKAVEKRGRNKSKY